MTVRLLFRLGLPAACAVLAAFINFGAVRSSVKTTSCTVITRRVGPGEPLDLSLLGQMAIPGDSIHLKATFVPSEEREVILGTVAQRELHPGDLLMWRDVKRPTVGIEAAPDEFVLPIDLTGVAVETSMLFAGDIVSFWIAPPSINPRRALPATGIDPDYQMIGPFRVLSVGSDTSRNPEVVGSQGSRGGGPHGRGNERVISVAVKLSPDGRFDVPSRRLLEAHATKRLMAVVLRPGGQG